MRSNGQVDLAAANVDGDCPNCLLKQVLKYFASEKPHRYATSFMLYLPLLNNCLALLSRINLINSAGDKSISDFSL